MSLTTTQVNEVKKIVNEQVAYTAEQSHFTNLTVSEKLTTLIKSSLNRLNTDSFLREWFNEPTTKVPVLKDVILTDTIKTYTDIQNDYYGVVKIGEKQYITNKTVSDLMLNDSTSSFDIILSYSLAVGQDHRTIIPIQENEQENDFTPEGLLTKLPREAWVVYKYWLNRLTGTDGISFDSRTNTISGTPGSGTYPYDDDIKSLIITLQADNNANSNKTYTDYINPRYDYIKTLFNDYDSIRLIKISDVEAYISQYEKLDYTNDYQQIVNELYSKIDNTIDLVLSAPTISTWNKSEQVKQISSTGFTDNIAFYNPLLERTLNERFGYFPINQRNGYTIVCSKDTSKTITTETGKGGNVKEGVFAFSSFEGFLLAYGLKNIIASFNDTSISELPISAAMPPIITAIRYIGGTLAEGLIQQGTALPISANQDDIFINTSDRKIYRYSGTEWVSIGGSDIFKELGENTAYTERSIAIGKTDISQNVVLDVSGNMKLLGNLTISGDIFVKGGNYVVNAEEYRIKDNIIEINEGVEELKYADIDDGLKTGGIHFGRGKREDEQTMPTFKLQYTDRDTSDNYLEIGVEHLQRVATIDASKNESGLKEFVLWDASLATLKPQSTLSISNNQILLGSDVKIMGKLFDSEGEEYSAGSGGSLIKASQDSSANEILKNAQTAGDLYFNTQTQFFKLYSLNGWLNTEIGRIGAQPPPVQNLRYDQTVGFVTIKWDNPIQLPTAMTSDIPYNTEHSPAAFKHPITQQNIVYFPIVNRICVRITKMDGTYISYPMYQSNDAKVDSSFSQIVEGGNVVYRKGDIVAGQLDSSRNSYISDTTINRNLVANMPNELRIYKIVPSNLTPNLDLSFTILPFVVENNPLSVNISDPFKISIWLENNSLDSVNIQDISAIYRIAPAPSAISYFNMSFADTISDNLYPRIRFDIQDPVSINGNVDDITDNDILNIDQIKFEWSIRSINQTNWFPFARVGLSDEYINLDEGIQKDINRPIDTSILYNYYFDVSAGDLGDEFNTAKEALYAQELTNLYVAVRYKNGSNPAFTERVQETINWVSFDVPSQPQSVVGTFTDTSGVEGMNAKLNITDPEFVLANTNPTLQFTSIRFEWGFVPEAIPEPEPVEEEEPVEVVQPTIYWKRFKQINSTALDPSGILTITPRARRDDDENYTFKFNNTYLDGWNDFDKSTNVKVRVSYRNKAKPLFGPDTETKFLFEPPSIPTKNDLTFHSTTSFRETRCNVEITNPANILASQSEYNSIARYTGVQFQWGISGENIVWNNFVKIIDNTEEEKLSSGFLNYISPITTIDKSYKFDISRAFLGENTVGNDLSKNLLVRIRFANNAVFGENDEALSPWLNSNELYFDHPSQPRKNEIDYSTTLSNGLTRVKQIVIDPSFVLGTTASANDILKFTNIKFYWRSDKVGGNEWQPFTQILDSRNTPNVQILTNGEYDISNSHTDTPFTYTFDICSTYLGDEATSLIGDGSKNLSVYIQYKNSAVSSYSELLESNVILLEPPGIPPTIDLSFNRTYGAVTEPITECILTIADPQVMRTQPQYDDDISFTGLHFQWRKLKYAETDQPPPSAEPPSAEPPSAEPPSAEPPSAESPSAEPPLPTWTEGSWTDFSGVNYHSTLLPIEAPIIPLEDGIHSIVRAKLTTTRYTFAMTKPYLGSTFDIINANDKFQVQVRYRNSTLLEFSEYQLSNQLVFEEPSNPALIDLSFNNPQTTALTDISNTRYRITLTNPDKILKTNDINNSKINFTGIEFQWGISGENTQWNNFINIATTPAILTNSIASKNGIYQTNAKYTDVSNIFYFDTTPAYLDLSVNQILTDNSKNIIVRAKYRNSTVPEFSEYNQSNVLLINRPSIIQDVSTDFFRSYTSRPLSEAILNIKKPEYTISGDLLDNQVINLTGVRFQWKYPESTNWNDFKKIKTKTNIVNTTDVSDLINGIYTIRQKNKVNDLFDISYIYDISAEYLGDYTVYDGSSIDIQVSYRNTTIGQDISNGYNEPLKTSLLFEAPSVPVIVEISFNSSIGTPAVPITVFEIKVKDPEKTLKTLNNQTVFMKDISFQWTFDYDDTENHQWYDFKQMKLIKDISNVPYNINRARDATERTYTFEMSFNYLNQNIQLRDSSNLYVRASYRNTILPLINGNPTSSNAFTFEKPPAPEFIDLSFNSTLLRQNRPINVCQIRLKDPAKSLRNLDISSVFMKDISFQWTFDYNNTDNYPWYDFKQMKLINDISNVPYLVDRKRDNNERTYTFEMSLNYLDEFIEPVDGSNLYVRASYRNKILPLINGDLSYSNPLLFETPPAPHSVELSFNSTIGTELEPITVCQIILKDPNQTMKTANNQAVFMKDISFQWTFDYDYTNEYPWYDFKQIKRIKDGSEPVNDLSNVPYIVNRARDDDERTYTFEMSSNYLDNFIQPVDNSNLYVRVSYRNTALQLLNGPVLVSNPLLFERPSIPLNVDLSYIESLEFPDSLDSSTRYSINIKPPEYMLGSNNLTNNKIHFTGIEFKWSISAEPIVWRDFSNISLVQGQVSNRIREGSVFSTNTSHTDTSTNFNFVSSLFYFKSDDLKTIIDACDNYLLVRVRYRNSTVPGWSDYLSSNALLLSRPDPIENVSVGFNNTTTSPTMTTGRITITKPINIINNDPLSETNNGRLDLRRLQFQWRTDKNSSWYDFTAIKTGLDSAKIDVSSGGIYRIPTASENEIKVSPDSINYYFDLSSDYLGESVDNLIGHGSKNLIVRVAYANTVVNRFSHYTETPPLYFSHPSKPNNVVLTFKENTMPSNVKTSLTKMNIAITDPLSLLETTGNPDIFFTGILFEWSQTGNNDWNPFNKIHDGAVMTLSSGVYSTSSIQRTRDGTPRNFTFDISDEYISGFNPSTTQNTKLYVRTKYRNSVVSSFGEETTSVVSFGKPNIPTIVDVSMTDHSEITVYMGGILAQNIIDGFEPNVSTNTNNAVYIQKVQLRTEYDLSNGAITGISTEEFDFSGNTTEEEITQYKYYPIIDLSANELYKLRFQVRVKNNLVNEWSGYSVSGDFADVDISPNHLYITPPIEDNSINTLDIISGGNGVNQSLLNLSWNHPTIRKRGVVKTTKTDVPLIEKYIVSVYQPKILEQNRIVLTKVLNSTYRKEERFGFDPTPSINLTNSFDISSIILQNGTIGNAYGSGVLDTDISVNVEIQQKNQFVNKTTTISGEFIYKLVKPSGYDIRINNALSNTTVLNNLDVSWNIPTQDNRGFSVKPLYSTDFTTKNAAIYKYEIEISADRIGSNSPYYRSITNYPPMPKINFVVQSTDRLIDASNIILKGVANGNIIRRNNISNSSISGLVQSADISSVLVYPDTSYNISIRATNRFDISGDYLYNITRTGQPILPSGIKIFNNTDKLLPIATTGTAINGDLNSLADTNRYAIRGFVLNTTDPNLTNTFSTTYNVFRPQNLIFNSNSVNHAMNKYVLNSFINAETLAKTITDMSYVKMRQFQIVNTTQTTDMVYELGSNTNQFDISQAGPTVDMLRITSGNAQDVYKIGNNNDHFNQGYWWKEDISYQIDFKKKTDALYGKPILLRLGVKYNNEVQIRYPNFDFSANVFDTSRNILHDNNQPAYFDDLSQNSTFTAMNPDIVESDYTNKINGIPNLYPLGTIDGTTYQCKYKVYHYLDNYSKYFGLSGEIVYYETIPNVKDASFSWANKPTGMKRLERQWEISGVEITINAATNLTTPRIDLSMSVKHRNQMKTDFSSNLLSRRMIYDQTTGDTFKTLLPSLSEIPENFAPEYNNDSREYNSTIQTSNNPPTYTAYGTNINNLQLSMYNGLFRSNTNMDASSTITNWGLYLSPNITIPVQDKTNTYKWVIFKYTKSVTTTFTNPYMIMVSFGTNTNIKNSDINPTSGFPNAKVYFKIDGYSMDDTNDTAKKYFWLNIGDAQNTQNITPNGANTATYSGGLVSNLHNTMTEQEFIDSSVIVNSSTSSFSKFTDTPPKRILAAYNNGNGANIISNTTKTYYLAVGLLNSSNIYISKPDIRIARGKNPTETLQLM